MKLVLTFSIGDEFSSSDHVMPIEYESAEQLLVDLENEILKVANSISEYYKQREIWSKRYDVFKHRELRLSEKEREKWYEDNPRPDYVRGVLNFLDYDMWSIGDFYDFDNQQVYDIFEILTLDEWFERNKTNLK